MRDHTIGDLGIARRVEVIVVQVEDSVRVSRTSSLEGDGDEVLAQDLGEDGRAQRAVLVEDLVADVLDTHSSVHILPLGAPDFPRAEKGTNPCPDLALVPRHDRRDVPLQDRLQLRLVADVAHPARELRVPAQGVATDGLVVFGRPI